MPSTAEQVLDVIGVGAEDIAGNVVETIMRTSAFNKLMVKVEEKGRSAVVAEVKNNMFPLILFTVAGGMIGGYAAAKTGKAGPVILTLAAGVGVYYITRPTTAK